MKQKKFLSLLITGLLLGPGVQRWLKFAKYLPENKWEPIIYTPENPSYPLLDESLVKDVPKNIQIIQNKIWEPYQLAEKLNKKNKNLKQDNSM